MKNKTKIMCFSVLTGALLATSSFSYGQFSNNNLKYLYDLGDDIVIASDAYSHNDFFTSTDVIIPSLKSMVPQGITIVDDYYLISAYDYNKLENSCIYVLNMNGDIINCCDIGNKAHVGGICYDIDNDLIWITGESGYVNVYDKKDIFYDNSANPVDDKIFVGYGLKNYKYPFLNSASYLTVSSGNLFVGSFSLNDTGIVKEYKINYSDNITLSLVRDFKVPDKVQGIDFYEKNDNKYILFSRSYGKNIPSLLQIFKYDIDIDDYTDDKLNSVSVKMPSMMEQITFSKDLLYTLYESSARPYSKKDDLDKTIDSIDIKALVKEIK